MGQIDFTKYPYLATIGGEATLPDEKMEDLACKGWGGILTSMFDKINVAMDAAGAPRECFNIIQIKEKFGELRMYYVVDTANLPISAEDVKVLDEKVETIVNEAVDLTGHSCAVCGAEAEYHSTGWVLPYCEKCARESHNAANTRHKTNFDFSKSWVKISK